MRPTLFALVAGFLVLPLLALSPASSTPRGAVPDTHNVGVAAKATVAPSVTIARLGVSSTAILTGRSVSFSFAGSAIDRRFHLAHAVLDFGDKTSTSVTSLAHGKSHRYKRKGVYTVTLRLVDSSGKVATKQRTIVVVSPNTLRFRPGTRRMSARAVAAVRAIDAARLQLILVKGSVTPPVGSTLLVSSGALLPTGVAIVVRSLTRDHRD